MLPDHKLIAFATENDALSGLLHSRIHEVWSLGTGSWHGVGKDPSYAPSATFETIPFPAYLRREGKAVLNRDARDARDEKPTSSAISSLMNHLSCSVKSPSEARERWLNPPDKSPEARNKFIHGRLPNFGVPAVDEKTPLEGMPFSVRER